MRWTDILPQASYIWQEEPPRAGTKAREHPRNALATCPSCKNIQSKFNGWGWLKCLPKNKKSGRGCQKRTVLNRMFPMALSLGRPAGRTAGREFKKHPLSNNSLATRVQQYMCSARERLIHHCIFHSLSSPLICSPASIFFLHRHTLFVGALMS